MYRTDPMALYKARRREQQREPLKNYEVIGYIAAGTYGRVYKGRLKTDGRLVAIKKFKADKEGENLQYTGISQSAYREMALCRELKHENLVSLVETILEDKSIYLVLDYAEHDLLQIIHYHCHPDSRRIPHQTIKGILYQLLSGVDYLHKNWVLHRDLKPANIMITAQGVVKIGDLGLARIHSEQLQSLYAGDKVVVTIWYRAPELLLGGRHYGAAIDMWAVGCIFAEMLTLRPVFKGEEAKIENKKVMPFQRHQVQKVIEILGTPTPNIWPSITAYPEYPNLRNFRTYPSQLEAWYRSVGNNPKALNLLSKLFAYDPIARITAEQALAHPFFAEDPVPSPNVFSGLSFTYPARRITNDTNMKQPRKRTADQQAQHKKIKI